MPPWPRLLVLGMQYAMLMSVNLVLVVIVFRHAGANDAATLSALSFGLIALAISTVLQSVRKGPVGSGYLAHPDRREGARVAGENAKIRLIFSG